MRNLAPKNAADYEDLFGEWIDQYYYTHLVGFENRMSPHQKDLFFVQWKNTREHMSADVEGQMTDAILNACKLMNCDECQEKGVFHNTQRNA